MKIGALLLLIACTGCNSINNAKQDLKFTVSEDGGVSQTDKNRYESLGQQTYSRTQEYTFKTDDKIISGVLVASVTKVIGKKSDTADDVAIPIREGNGKYRCVNYYSDVPLNKSDDDVPDPVCKFKKVLFVTGVVAQVDVAK